MSQQGDEKILRRKKLPNPARRRKNPVEDEKLPNPARRRKNPEEDKKLPNPARKTSYIQQLIIKVVAETQEKVTKKSVRVIARKIPVVVCRQILGISKCCLHYSRHSEVVYKETI